jgi:hypothetical protein
LLGGIDVKLSMRILVGLVGLFNFLLGLGFLLNPVQLAARFALMPVGTQGLATIRADFPAFFITGAIFAAIGAWRADSRPLVVPLVLLGLALFGRFVSIALDGMAPTTTPPMIAEAVMIVILIVARRAFANPTDR